MDSWANRRITPAVGNDLRDGTGDCQTVTRRRRDNTLDPFDSDKVPSWKTNGTCP